MLKFHWLKDEDQNNWFFHCQASQHFRCNEINRLRNLDGSQCEEDDLIANEFVDFYQQLFSTSIPSHLEEVLDATPQVVTAEMNQMLLGVSSKQEVDIVVKQMSPLKASRLDGMPPLCYQHYWSSVGDDVS